MLTGLRPHEQDCWTNDDILDSARPTWLNGLGAFGYHPVLIGRMHALGPDQLRGYVDRPIGDHSPNWPGVARAGLGPLAKTSGPYKESVQISGPGQSSYQLMDADVLAASVAFLKDHAASGTDAPFCLTTSFMLPHPPYVASQADFDAVKDQVGPPTIPIPPMNEHEWIKTWRETKNLSDATDADIHRARCSYYALTRQLDRAVGTLLDTLTKIGADENTLIIYVSDHGDHIGERGLFWKHTFYEDAIKVPLLMSWPAKIKPGTVCDTPIETGALGNTVLACVGAPPLPNASMKSFASCLDGTGFEPDPVYIEYCTDDLAAWAEGFSVQQRAVIEGDFKYIYYHGYDAELYNLRIDPHEMTNLVDQPALLATASRLRELVLEDWNAADISQRIERKRADKLLLKTWAEKTKPANVYGWKLEAEQNEIF